MRRVNDWLLKINDVDLTNKDRKQVIKAVLSGEGVINMVVRRRKSLGGRVITPIQLNLAGHKGGSQLMSIVGSVPFVFVNMLYNLCFCLSLLRKWHRTGKWCVRGHAGSRQPGCQRLCSHGRGQAVSCEWRRSELKH